MVKMDPSKLVPPGTNFSITKDPPRTYFTTKYGLPLKNLKREVKECRPWTYFTCKIWTSGILVSEVSGNYSGPSVQQHAIHCSLIPSRMQESLSTCNPGATEAYSVIHFSRYATVNSTNVLSSHWFFFRVTGLQMGTNFSEWVQIFQKNSFWGEPILGGSKLNVTVERLRIWWHSVGSMCMRNYNADC